MTPEEVRELLDLRFDGRVTHLASALDMTEAGVRRWLDGTRGPRGPAAILLRLWLDEARAGKEPAKAS